MLTRLDKIKSMTAEQTAILLIDNGYFDKKSAGEYFCKGDCEWANSMEIGDGANENECIECCVRWLNEEVE